NREAPTPHSVNATPTWREERSSSGIRETNTMKTITNKYLTFVVCLGLLLSFGLAIDAHAQAAAAQAHVAAAQAAMAPKTKNALRPFDTFKALVDQMCAPPKQLPDVVRAEDRSAPRPRKDWYQPPAQIFDNFYFIGTKGTGVYAVNS